MVSSDPPWRCSSIRPPREEAPPLGLQTFPFPLKFLLCAFPHFLWLFFHDDALFFRWKEVLRGPCLDLFSPHFFCRPPLLLCSLSLFMGGGGGGGFPLPAVFLVCSFLTLPFFWTCPCERVFFQARSFFLLNFLIGLPYIVPLFGSSLRNSDAVR